MASDFEENLEKYAEVIVKVGLNIQPGQQLLIGTLNFALSECIFTVTRQREIHSMDHETRGRWAIEGDYPYIDKVFYHNDVQG